MATTVERNTGTALANPTKIAMEDRKQKKQFGSIKETEFPLSHPSVLRKIFRQNKVFKYHTAGACKGYTQANLSILPSHLSKDFEEFCHANSGPLPLLFNSTPGQFSCPGLVTSEESDIRTDVPAYRVFENGVCKSTVPDLTMFGSKLDDYCFFYLGCSFSFDEALLREGIPLRNLEKGIGQVSMYRTSVWCKPVGPFNCPQVVSMRSIPKQLVEKAFSLTIPMDTVHGAPVHIGDPAVIGIKDVNEVDYGEPTQAEPGDVPVFWPCGVTGLEAMMSVAAPLTFTHSPGSMFITDELLAEAQQSPPGLSPKVVWLKDDPVVGSVLSTDAYNKIKDLQKLAANDPGHRNIGPLVLEEDLIKSALSVSHAKSVALITGFPVCEVQNPYETDGPAGLVALAQVLITMRKEVVFIVDETEIFGNVMKSVMEEAINKGALTRQIPIVLFAPTGSPQQIRQKARDFLTECGEGNTPRFDHIIASERVGRAKDGHYYTMKGRDISSKLGHLDVLFEVAKEIPLMATTGIGDGGNELGMGKVTDLVVQHIPLGDKIACTVPADFLIVAGVSDWGAHALCNALYALYTCPVHDRYRRRAVGFPPTEKEIQRLKRYLPNFSQGEIILKALVHHHFLDMTGRNCMAVDGMDFYEVHAPQMARMGAVVER